MSDYLVVVELNEYETSIEYFEKLISAEFPWSVRLFDSIFVVNSDREESEVLDIIYSHAQTSLINRLEVTSQLQMELAGGDQERQLDRSRAVINIMVSEIGRHAIFLHDEEKSNYVLRLLERRHISGH